MKNFTNKLFSFSKLFIALLFLFSSMQITAQEDAKAKAILEKLSKKTKAFATISATFKYTMENKADGVTNQEKGNIDVKGSKYILKITGNDIYCDGKTVWTYLKDADEVQINEASNEEDDINPTQLFTLYEKGFNYAFLKQINDIQIINLYPKDPKSKNYHRIGLYIDAKENSITKIKIYEKSGTISTYTILSFEANKEMTDNRFIFNSKAHPELEIIDLRD